NMFLPKTFRGGGHEVTINGDRSINVKQGDWLSKYSMAIYGDFDHIDKFCKKNGSLYEAIKDKSLVKPGDILYHLDPLPGERRIATGERIGVSEPPPPAQYVMGHDDRERRRLALQASILNPLTEQLLRRAGISTGTHVLDLGCGIGEVSLM